MPCGTCAKMRSHMPEVIRTRLEALEKKMQAKRRPEPVVRYTVTPPSVKSDARKA